MKIMVLGESSEVFAGMPVDKVRADLRKHFVTQPGEALEVQFVARDNLGDGPTCIQIDRASPPDLIITDTFDGVDRVHGPDYQQHRTPVMLCKTRGDSYSFDAVVMTEKLLANQGNPSNREAHQRKANEMEEDTIVFEGGLRNSYHQMLHDGPKRLAQWRAHWQPSAGTHVAGEVTLGTARFSGKSKGATP